MSFFKLIRLPNLIIVAVTQYILFYRIILIALEKGNIAPLFDDLHFALLVLTTLCVTAGSYISNDIKDLEIDKINKPDKVIIGKQISEQVTYWATGVIFLLGFLLAFHLALYAMVLPYLLIYPLAVIGLVGYNLKWKGTPLIGNLIVSIYCAGVAAIIWLAEEPRLSQMNQIDPTVFRQAWTMLLWFMVFAFSTNLIREIIKDLQDMEGDQEGDLKTIPIVWGTSVAKIMAVSLSTLLLFFILFYARYFHIAYQQLPLVIISSLLAISLLVIIFLTLRANTSINYKRISQLLKLVMVLGLILLLLFKF